MKHALITGGAKRIGAAIAKDLAQNGFDVAIQYSSSKDEAAELVDSLNEFGVNASAIQSDLLKAGAAQSLFAEASGKLGTIDLLINNASVFEADEVGDFNEDLWDKHQTIHLKVPSILCSQMAAQRGLNDGLVVNIIDQRVLRLNPAFYTYTLSKAGLWTATRTMAQSLAPRIRVNGIGPGPTMPNARQRQEDFQRQIDGLLLKRGPELEEFGETVRYLYRTKSVTGQMIALDGGQHLAWETPDIAGIPE